MSTDVDDAESAFFCLVDGPGYLPKAITALRSFQRFHPSATCAVVGRFGDDAGAMALIEHHGLTFRQLDLSHVFSDTVVTPAHPKVTWPSECFWWAAAPALFLAEGRRYSVGVDGDTLCVAPLDLGDLFDERSAIAAVAKRNGRVNSGVLFFDNDRLADLYDRAVDVYQTAKSCDHAACTGFCRTKSDQGLLCEMEERTGLAVRRIDNAYNHMVSWDGAAYLDHNPRAPFGIDDSKVLHLLSKPWNPPSRLRSLPAVTCAAYRAWWRFAADVWPDPVDRRARFGDRYAVKPGRSLSGLLLRPIRDGEAAQRAIG